MYWFGSVRNHPFCGAWNDLRRLKELKKLKKSKMIYGMIVVTAGMVIFLAKMPYLLIGIPKG